MNGVENEIWELLIGRKLEKYYVFTKSMELFRTEEAKRLMSPEVLLFYTANVLHKAKYEKIASDYYIISIQTQQKLLKF